MDRSFSDLEKAYVPQHREIKMVAEIAAIEMPSDEAIAIGLIINELLTNALKYAFPQTRSGTIQITVSSELNKLSLNVADNGVGESQGKTGTGFGMKLVGLLAEQLGGQVGIEINAGRSVSITGIPLPTH